LKEYRRAAVAALDVLIIQDLLGLRALVRQAFHQLARMPRVLQTTRVHYFDAN
jgi:hypothetical protein